MFTATSRLPMCLGNVSMCTSRAVTIPPSP
jgi:hypothetical protein